MAVKNGNLRIVFVEFVKSTLQMSLLHRSTGRCVRDVGEGAACWFWISKMFLKRVRAWEIPFQICREGGTIWGAGLKPL